MLGGSSLWFLVFPLAFIFSLSSDQIGGGFLVCYFSSLSLLLFVFGCSDGMEREACVCDHGLERSDLCTEIIIIIIITVLTLYRYCCTYRGLKNFRDRVTAVWRQCTIDERQETRDNTQIENRQRVAGLCYRGLETIHKRQETRDNRQ